MNANDPLKKDPEVLYHRVIKILVVKPMKVV
jgi:hypothetical protein